MLRFLGKKLRVEMYATWTPPSKFLAQIIAFVRTHPNMVFLYHKGRNFSATTDKCKLAAPINSIRCITAGKLDSFRLDFVSVSDECGWVIWLPLVCYILNSNHRVVNHIDNIEPGILKKWILSGTWSRGPALQVKQASHSLVSLLPQTYHN